MAPTERSTRRSLGWDLGIAIATGIILIFTYLFIELLLPRYTHVEFTSWELLAFEAGFVLLVGYLFSRALGRAVTHYFGEVHEGRHATGIRLVVNIAIAAVVLVAVASIFGVSVDSIFFGSAFAGIVLGLASQTVISNIFAGMVLLFTRPFRVGEKVGLISSSYGALSPSYPHELVYPAYTGTVRDIGLFYTVLELEGGKVAQVANSLVLSALIINYSQSTSRVHRVRVTFPLKVSVKAVEAILAEPEFSAPLNGYPIQEVRLELADLSPTTWDGVVVITTVDPDEDRIRDRILRRLSAEVIEATAGPVPPPERKPDGSASRSKG
ncbi:MAG: mechanosensitive ion channel family protein [Thermoplasmata archaeon]